MSANTLLPRPEDEGWHTSDGHPWWSESYYLDGISADGATGYYLRIGRLDERGVTHASVAIVHRGGQAILLVDDAAALPEGNASRQRVVANTFTIEIETIEALQVMRATVTGTGQSFDDPSGALHQEVGIATQVALDLTWTTNALPYRWRHSTRYEIPCRVTGTVGIDGDIRSVDGPGQRDHSWGPRDWWQVDWCWAAFHLEDGSRWHTVAVPAVAEMMVGYQQNGGILTDLATVSATTEYTANGLFGPTVIETTPGGRLTATPIAFGPIRMDGEHGAVSFFPRALCDVVCENGRRGIGWIEWNIVQAIDPAADKRFITWKPAP